MTAPTALQLPVIAHELMRAATGHPITVQTLDGQDVTLRLATPDELLQANQTSAAETHGSDGQR